MTARRLLRLILLMVCLWALGLGALARAQDNVLPESLGAVLVDVPIASQFVLSVPEDWIVWRREEYPTLADSARGLQALYVEVLPSVVPQAGEQISAAANLVALRPGLVNGSVVQMIVGFARMDEVAQVGGLDAEAATPSDFLTAMNHTDIRAIEINGRPAAIALRATADGGGEFAAIYTFPDENLLALVSFRAPAAYFDPAERLIQIMATSLRRTGEAFDTRAWAGIGSASAEPAAVFLVRSTAPRVPLNPTAEPTPEVTAQAEPAGQPTETPIVCAVTGTLDMNRRLGPGTNFDIAGVLRNGESAPVIGYATDAQGFRWWQLVDGSWVRDDLVTKGASCESVPQVG